MVMVDVDAVCRELERAGVTGVDGFRKRLHDNRGCQAVVEGLLFEARTALRYRRVECAVEMRDRPDLEVTLRQHLFFAEVTHFRRKRQDDEDDARLLAATDLLVPYGDTTCTEGKAAWDQLVEVAGKKADQYRAGSPNVLVVNSCTANCIDEVITPTAICGIDSICRADPTSGLKKLNGILLITEEISLSRGGRSCYYFPCGLPAVAMPDEVAGVLHSIEA
jgi:hypothetical protein